MMKNTALVVRLFNGGAGRLDGSGNLKPFDEKWFAEKANALAVMLAATNVERIVVVNNRDPESKFGEAADANGDTPTGRATKAHFATFSGRVDVVYVDQWGNNAGSGRAVQAGIDHLTAHSTADTFMVWSPEMAIDPERLTAALAYMSLCNHDVVGFLRENWQNRPQWMIPQHTGFIGTRDHWALATVPLKADGDEGRTVMTDVGAVAAAGMDDFCRLLEVMKLDKLGSIGMFKGGKPVPWQIDWNDQRQIEKIARQWQVALLWVKDSFPDADPEDMMNEFFDRHININ